MIYERTPAKIRKAFKGVKDSYDIRLKGKRIENIIQTTKKRPIFDRVVPVDRNTSTVFLLNEDRNKLSTTQTKLMREVESALRRARLDLRRQFEDFDSLSPFRDQPERTYLFTGENASGVGRTGTKGTSILVNDSSKRGQKKDFLIDRISEWLRITGIANSLILHPLTDRHFELCIEDLDGQFHNICDVGFGCSQVLPVLIGALNIALNRSNIEIRRNNSIFVVQEPEIHLHPNAQASLGSFFVSLFQQAGQLFVETHSDALVLRIARHVALKELNPKDVAVFFFSNTEAGKIVEQLTITDRGTFAPPWPGGFFPQREVESLGLARARNTKPRALTQQLEFKYPEIE